MNVLLVHPGPAFSVADVFNGWSKGLAQSGCKVKQYSLHDRLAFYARSHLERDGEYVRAFDWASAVHLAVKGLEAACYELDPDLVVVVSGFFITEELCATIRRHGTRIALVHTESPYEDDKQAVRAEWVDANVLNDPANLDRFPDNTIFLPHCYDPDVHYPRDPNPDRASEFFFCGTGYRSRVEFFEQVDWKGIDAKLAGNWSKLPETSPLQPLLVQMRSECMDNYETVDWYCSTLTSANLYRKEANADGLEHGWSCGPREIELAACGVWFARQSRGESDELFPMLPTFDTPEELGDIVRWAVSHEDERYDATVKAYGAIQDRTFDRNAAELLSLLGV